jgi:tetratricopeptide (TPR) repeat protein
MPRSSLRRSSLLKSVAAGSVALVILASGACWGQTGNRAKAHALVDAAIQMSDTNQALKLLWQATDIDPTLNESYIYLGLYYNSREDFPKVVEVYQKLIKYQPREVSAYLNIGEAYMSFTPPNYQEALASYRKGYAIDSGSSFAALRIGQILAHQGNRAEAERFLKQASADTAKNATIAAEAQKELRQLGGF